jgi:hypothetical protein
MNVTTPLRLVFDPTGDLLEAARECEADIFLRTFGNTREHLQAEYSRYEDASVFIVLADPDDKVVGVCRLIMPSEAGFKSLNDLAESPWNVDGERAARAAGVDLARTWDFATIGVRSGTDRSVRMFAAIALYHGVLTAGRVNGIESVVMIMDDRALALITAGGITTHRLPGTKAEPYLGSPASTPVYGNFAEMIDTARRTNPEAYRLLVLGVGLDGVTVPEQEAFRLVERRPATTPSAAHSALASRA